MNRAAKVTTAVVASAVVVGIGFAAAAITPGIGFAPDATAAGDSIDAKSTKNKTSVVAAEPESAAVADGALCASRAHIPWVQREFPALVGTLVDNGPTELADGQVGYDAEGQIATYTVQPGEAGESIGNRFCIDFLSLASYNGRNGPKVIQPGDVLVLRPTKEDWAERSAALVAAYDAAVAAWGRPLPTGYTWPTPTDRIASVESAPRTVVYDWLCATADAAARGDAAAAAALVEHRDALVVEFADVGADIDEGDFRTLQQQFAIPVEMRP
ncbi:LysM peptidoglycan-binding domain-containing protein [Microbacterium sp. NPDC058389]|uniref:LysM peptidoglycan-binding domain-containing protein n=1 Tax=Microbacterium sp. NPDC058389 TaxID=3346475 RepID=UPI0036548FF2